MSKYLERAEELRAITERHYNCAQSVLVPFAADLGLDEEMAYRIAAHYGAGMKMGSVCGAVTGALMVLGLAGKDDPDSAYKLYRKIKANHDGFIDCRDLLRINAEKGGEKKPHCDAMVYEAIKIVEEML